MYPHITFQLHDRERGKLWHLIENAEVGHAYGLTGSIQPCWLMGRFLFHLVCQRRIICQDQDCESRSLWSLRVAFPLQSNPALDLFWNFVSFNTASSDLRSIRPLESSVNQTVSLEQLAFCGRSSFHFVPGSFYDIGHANAFKVHSTGMNKTATPNSTAKLETRSLQSLRVAFPLQSNPTLDFFGEEEFV